MARKIAHVADLDTGTGRQLILNKEIDVLRVRGDVVRLDSPQLEAAGVHAHWIEGNALEAERDVGCRRASGISDGSVGGGCAVIRIIEFETELERVVLAEIGTVAAILKPAIKETITPTDHQLRSRLVGESESRGEVGFLRFAETRIAAVNQGDAVTSQGIYKRGGERIALPLDRNQILRSRPGSPRNKIRLRAVMLVHLLKVVPTHAQIQGQL